MEQEISDTIGENNCYQNFLLAKLNHLFLTLPNPGKAFIGELNDLFHKFIWSNKPDKINRKTITLRNHSRGLKLKKIAVLDLNISYP